MTQGLDVKPTLLLVEDSAADVQILQRALRASGRTVDLRVTRDGQEAMDYLLGQGPFHNDPNRPDLVLLDLNLPRLTGLEVLERMRAHHDLRAVPVVVWTTSRQAGDIRAGYAAGANSYVQKPAEFDRLREVLEATLRYWFDTALLPGDSAVARNVVPRTPA
jgi:CheY-like chemotaxis protein